MGLCDAALFCKMLSVSNVRHVGMQDDLLYETLTVYETLYYAAMLRLPASMTTAQKCERVENVILSLGLDKCRDTIVGAPHPPCQHSIHSPSGL